MRLAPFVLLLLAAPWVQAAALVDGDAGSGGDAPSDPRLAFLVQPGVVYDATAPSGDVDAFALEAQKGDLLELRVSGTLCSISLRRPDGSPVDGRCNLILLEEAIIYELRVDEPGRWAFVTNGLLQQPAYRFSFTLSSSAPPARLLVPATDAGPSPWRAPTPSSATPPRCSPTEATSGDGGTTNPSLVFAVVKAGTRVAIAWETQTLSGSRVVYSVDAGRAWEVTETTPRQQHLVVLDDLPAGGLLCFRVATDSPTYALRLADPRASPGHDGVHTMHLLALATETLAPEVLDDGFALYARKLWDATDGHVRLGTVILVTGDPETSTLGAYACDAARRAPALPPCSDIYDVVLTHDVWPLATGITLRDGIADPRVAIWLNALHESPIPLPTFGTVWNETEFAQNLLHETGHYAFGMDDLYGGDGANLCQDPAWSISIMDSAREPREFDDEVARCPRADELPGYVPSWTLLRTRWPAIPDRPLGPTAGPEGDGGAFRVRLADFRG